MTIITLSADDLKKKIEEHFKAKGLKVELYLTSVAESGGMIHSVKLEGIFNSGRILEFSIYYNRKNEPLITDFKGICPIGELAEILNELKIIIDKL